MTGLNMDIREISDEEKQETYKRFHAGIANLRSVLKELEQDIESDNLQVQTSAIWITGNLLQGFSDFMANLRKLQETQSFEELKEGIKEASLQPKECEHE